MTNQERKEVLERAVHIAETNGFKWSEHLHLQWVSWAPINEEYQLIIYNHDFARALWGEEPTDCIGVIDEVKTPITGVTIYSYQDKRVKFKKLYNVLNWQYHLQQMVIAPDPLEYLQVNLLEGDNNAL